MPDIEPTVLQQRTLVRAVVEQVESSALEPGIERVYSLAEIATGAGDLADSRRWNRTMARSPAAEAGMR